VRGIIVIVLILALSSLASAQLFDPRVNVSNFDQKIMKVTTQFVHLSFKIDIYLPNSAGDVYVTFNGIDNQGFESGQVIFIGYCDYGRTTTLTTTRMIEPQKYAELKEWRIHSVRLSPPRPR